MKYGEIDNVDKKILSMLKENARISNVEIARALRLSHTAVNKRIKQLEDAKEITGYTLRYEDQTDSIRYILQVRTKPGRVDDAIHSLRGEKWALYVMKCNVQDSFMIFSSLKDEFSLRMMMRALINEDCGVVDYTLTKINEVFTNLSA